MARCLLGYDEYFLSIATNAKVLEIIRGILGDYFVLNLQNSIINYPHKEHHQSSWHRDLPYQNYVISKPLAINAIFCIDEFSDITGGTIIVSHTHRFESIPSNSYIEKHKITLNAKPGDVAIFDSMLLHKAGSNKSNIIRRGINHIFASGILKQQINLPKLLGDKYKDAPFLRVFLGYDSDVPNSDIEWRESRYHKYLRN